MEYTVQKLAKLAGVSSRTLRYYDEINLLKPARINSSGYRIYGKSEVDLLQQILFYRELGVDLETIKKIITSPFFQHKKALNEHLEKLMSKRNQLDELITNVKKTIETVEGRLTMSDYEKFEGFKQKLIDENEEKYGQEIRQKYGDEAINQSNHRMKNMSQEEYNDIEKLSSKVLSTLHEAFETGDPSGDLAQKAVELHRQWISFYWEKYSKEAHAGLGQMYVDDERFTVYYDKKKPGVAKFLRDAILIYTGMDKSN